MKFKISKIFIFLSLIFLLAISLRLTNITTNPPGLYGDEVTMVYDAYSISQTGKDQTGAFLPLTFKMGDSRPPGYVYATVPFAALFGPTAISSRIVSVLSGVGLVILIYLIASRLIDQKVGVWAGFLVAINPWSINLSRAGFESNLALFLSMLGFWFFLKAARNSKNYIWSAVAFGLALNTYPTYKLLIPLFLIAIFTFVFNSKKIGDKVSRDFLVGLLVFCLFGLVLLTQIFTGKSENRFLSINLYSNPSVINTITEQVNMQRGLTNLPVELVPFFYNKWLGLGELFIEHYLSSFSTNFLFLKGDGNPRHNMTQSGGFFAVEFITILMGFLICYEKKRRLFYFLLGWIGISPLASALIENPHFLRSSLMIPPFIILSAIGWVYFFEKNRFKKNLGILLVVFLMIQLVLTYQRLFFLSPEQYGKYWSYTAKAVSEKINYVKKDFDYVIVSDRIDNIPFVYLASSRIDPKLVIDQVPVSLGDLNFKKYDNVYIGNVRDGSAEKLINQLPGRVLYIGSLGEERFMRDYKIVRSRDEAYILLEKE